jgi:hypothetical protein
MMAMVEISNDVGGSYALKWTSKMSLSLVLQAGIFVPFCKVYLTLATAFLGSGLLSCLINTSSARLASFSREDKRKC